MKRKLLTLVLAGAMVCSLAACGGNNNSESSEHLRTAGRRCPSLSGAAYTRMC